MEILAKVKKITFTLQGGEKVDLFGFFPVSRQQSEKMKRIKPDEVVTVSYKRFRKKNKLDQAFAVVNFLWHNWRDEGHYPNVSVFRDFISLHLGYSYPVYNCGNVVMIPKTWSFKTGEDEFNDGLYNPLIDFTCDYMQMDRDWETG